jgi:hypothetical protein
MVLVNKEKLDNITEAFNLKNKYIYSNWTLKKSHNICIYTFELEIKDTTDTARSASYLDLHIGIHNEGRIRTKLYNKEIIFIYM